jgi:hypothetical protein
MIHQSPDDFDSSAGSGDDRRAIAVKRTSYGWLILGFSAGVVGTLAVLATSWVGIDTMNEDYLTIDDAIAQQQIAQLEKHLETADERAARLEMLCQRMAKWLPTEGGRLCQGPDGAGLRALWSEYRKQLDN